MTPVFLMLLLVPICGPVAEVLEQEPPKAINLLSKASIALHTRDYDGIFIYHYYHPHKFKTMRLVHKYVDGNEYRRIIAIDGAYSEVIQDPAGVRCIFPKQKIIIAGGEKAHSLSAFALPFPDLNVMSPSESDLEYEFSLLAEDRVANRDAWVVNVVPQDQYRYGYRLWIDKQDYFPLKTELRALNGEVLENILFTHLEMPKEIHERLLYPDFPTEGFTWMLDREASASTEENVPIATWQATRLPSGFQLKRQNIYFGENLPGEVSKSALTHMAYSDGLATFSIFVRKSAGGSKQLAKEKNMPDGGMHVYTRVIDGWDVTVIGEVPEKTVTYVGESVRRSQP
ncbi:MAG: MucB/RseB C-terminal domain-containing protein [Candidatus Eutrophobiaceae bacterium]